MLNLTKNPIVKFCKTINILVPANTLAGTKVFFPFDEEISNCKLTGLIFNPSIDTLQTGNISGNLYGVNFVGQTTGVDCYITLCNHKNENIVNQLPVMALWNMNASGNITIRRFSNYIDLGKSYIVLTNTVGANKYFSFTFYYTTKN